MTYTGGELNLLNGKMGISDPNKSVPVMKLIKIHQPKSKEALVQLIAYHKNKICKCGIKSTGTVEDFGHNLYNAQMEYWKENKYSLKECIQWEYDLFVVQSLKGGIIEKKALTVLEKKLEPLIVEEAMGYLDEELRIDIVIYDGHKNEIAGVQVKPNTFNKMRSEVKHFQKMANQKWGKPVYFLFYDKEENFMTLDDVVNSIKNLNLLK